MIGCEKYLFNYFFEKQADSELKVFWDRFSEIHDRKGMIRKRPVNKQNIWYFTEGVLGRVDMRQELVKLTKEICTPSKVWRRGARVTGRGLLSGDNFPRPTHTVPYSCVSHIRTLKKGTLG